MDYTVLMDYAAKLMAVMFALVFVTTIIVEVLKVIFSKLPTNYLAIAVAIVVTLLAFFAWASFTGLAVLWYYVVGAVVLGIFVAYASMFGFDKFKEAFEKLKQLQAQK